MPLTPPEAQINMSLTPAEIRCAENIEKIMTHYTQCLAKRSETQASEAQIIINMKNKNELLSLYIPMCYREDEISSLHEFIQSNWPDLDEDSIKYQEIFMDNIVELLANRTEEYLSCLIDSEDDEN